MKLTEHNRAALSAALPAIKEIIEHVRKEAFQEFEQSINTGGTDGEWGACISATRRITSLDTVYTLIANAAERQ